jgi:Na+-driven multidrug efflux pump
MIYMLVAGWLIWIPSELVILKNGGGIIPAWISLTVYVLILAGGFWWRWQSGRWRKIDLLEREVPLVPTRTGAEGLTVAD